MILGFEKYAVNSKGGFQLFPAPIDALGDINLILTPLEAAQMKAQPMMQRTLIGIKTMISSSINDAPSSEKVDLMTLANTNLWSSLSLQGFL